MDILEIISTRRSVREYKKERPSDGDIKSILEAGHWAPSGLNNQPWRFIVIDDNDRKEGLARFTKYDDMIIRAPVSIVILFATTDSYDRDKDMMAMGACIQNMMLEAHSLDIGSCWLGEITNRKEDAAMYLGLDNDLEIVAVLTFGYSNEPITEGWRKPLKDMIIL